MIQQALLALVLASLTIVIHALATVHIVMPAAGVWVQQTARPPRPAPVMALTRLVGALLVLHLVEMAIWGSAFAIAGVMPDFESSLHYSLESYTTVGYGYAVPPSSWRLLGPIESAVGVLMLGWSTGIIVAAVQRIYKTRLRE
jgi:hypothetical protein